MQLSSLRPDLDRRQVPLYGILHEELGAKEFKSYLYGDLFYDKEKVFYGPKETRMGVLGLLRWSVIRSFLNASLEGVNGNMKGDGTLLGSSLVVGPGDQGILFQYRSREFGDRANIKDILRAVENIKSN